MFDPHDSPLQVFAERTEALTPTADALGRWSRVALGRAAARRRRRDLFYLAAVASVLAIICGAWAHVESTKLEQVLAMEVMR
ncbi:MAG: hypothetical protein AB8H86_31900 [Polyangiales bacterium]